MLQSFQELLVESRRKKRGQFAERLLALQKKASFELMSLTYDILHKPVRTRIPGERQSSIDLMPWEDALRQACSDGDSSIEILLDIETEYHVKYILSPLPDKVNILKGTYSIFDTTAHKYVEFPGAPNLLEDLQSKLDPGFALQLKELTFNKVSVLTLTVPLPEDV
jgi:hypothetical protein